MCDRLVRRLVRVGDDAAAFTAEVALVRSGSGRLSGDVDLVAVYRIDWGDDEWQYVACGRPPLDGPGAVWSAWTVDSPDDVALACGALGECMHEVAEAAGYGAPILSVLADATTAERLPDTNVRTTPTGHRMADRAWRVEDYPTENGPRIATLRISEEWQGGEDGVEQRVSIEVAR